MTQNAHKPMFLKRVERHAENVRQIRLSWSELDAERHALRLSMLAARKQGFTLQQIGDAAGVSKQRVSQLLNKP